MTSIRPAELEDAPAIARVHIDAWRTAYRGMVPDAHLDGLDIEQRTARWRENLGKPGFTFVAEREGRGVFGFAGAGADRTPGEGFDGELYALYLAPGQLRRGAGTALVRAVVARFVTQGVSTMRVWVLAENPARRFYQALGGVELATKKIEIGGALLDEVSYGWRDLSKLRDLEIRSTG